ncbi:MAG: hypothetical protein EBZ63_05305 [Burkholderiaceae bacterium]|nr:hypothetical protein [Burkholderiaceae bacterium]
MEIINNNINKEELNNGIINNVNITINNHITDNKIPYVYPFGYENINFLTDEDILEIIKSPNSASLLLKKIYSHVDNNNFMKLNNKDKTISYIQSADTIDLCDDKDFIKMLYEKSRILLDRIFNKYYTNLNYEHQLVSWNYINDVLKKALDDSNKYAEKIYNNFISQKSYNIEAKRRYKEIKNSIEKNQRNVIEKNKKKQNEVNNEINNMNTNMKTKSLDLKEVNATIWDFQMQQREFDLFNTPNNSPLNNYYDNTPRYKKRQDLERQEDEYLSTQELTIGDIKDIADMKKKRNEKELYDINSIYPELTDEIKTELETMLIKKPVEDNINKILSVKPKYRLQRKLNN